MSPRPLDPEPTPFEDSIELAQEGKHREALSGLARQFATGALHEQHRAAAAGALTRVARLAEAAGDLDSAEHAFEEALRLVPEYADLNFHYACALLANRKRPEARRALSEALRINPRYLAARLELILLDAREGLLGEALERLRGMEDEQRAEDPRAFRLGLKSLEQADWEGAEAMLQRAFHLSEPGVEEVIQVHRRLLEKGDHAGALQLLRECLRRHEGYADLHYLLGVAELEQGQIDDAIASLARALELHPDYHMARVQFARALEALGDIPQAAEQVASVLEHDPDHPQALQLQERWSRRQSHRRRTPAAARKAS